MNYNVHVFCKMIFHNKFEFILETVFSYTGAQQTLRTMLPALVLQRQNYDKTKNFHTTSSRSTQWKLLQAQPRENICFKTKWWMFRTTFRSTSMCTGRTTWTGTCRRLHHACFQGGTKQNTKILWTEKQGYHFGAKFHLLNWWPRQDQ